MKLPRRIARDVLARAGILYDLVDAVARNRASPNTFRLPPAEELLTLGPGDFVRLGFLLPRKKGNLTVERMWVEITAVHDNVITGTLANHPQYLDAHFGDAVKAERRHVLQIHQAKRRLVQ